VAVASAGVSVLSFSNNPAIAGGNVFVLGPTFENTARRLGSFAVRSGKSKVMIVHDQNAQGEAGRTAIQSGMAAAGGSVVAVGSYEFSQNGIVQAIPGIAAQAKASGAQAVFLTADTAGALPLVSQLLSENGINPANVQYIGLTRWDIPAATLALPGVQGGVFAMPDPTLYAQYQARYQSSFGEPPHPVSAIAYDGIAAIGALAKQGRGLDRASLTQGAGFVGVNGVFRLLANGTNERGLAIARITNSTVSVIDPAPRSFGGAGS
jgi:ABC-type branched-subunit amino acid transport system substrate-binding protein